APARPASSLSAWARSEPDRTEKPGEGGPRGRLPAMEGRTSHARTPNHSDPADARASVRGGAIRVLRGRDADPERNAVVVLTDQHARGARLLHHRRSGES